MVNRIHKVSTFLRCTIIFLFIVTILLSIALSGPNFEGKDFRKEQYVVKSQDTLWSIGKKCVDDEIDVREWISAVRHINEIDANIYPGQVIIVYVLNR